jgi:hypothetical protein
VAHGDSRIFASHEFFEDGAGFVAGAPSVGCYAGQGREGEGAEEFIVVDTEHGDFVRDVDGEAAAGIEHLAAEDIITSEDCERARLTEEPLAEGFEAGIFIIAA